MADIIRIGKPTGFGKAVRLMTADECRTKREREHGDMLAAELAGSKFQLRQVIRHMRVVQGDGVTKCALLEVANEFWPEG